MAEGLVKMSEQFGGLPMEALIGGPLQAACKSQLMLAKASADFIQDVCMEKAADGTMKIRNVAFSFQRAANSADGSGAGAMENVEMQVPLLTILKIPSLLVDTVDVTFDMEVKSSETSKEVDDKKGELDATAGLKVGPFHMDVHVKGSISSHKENTRSSDNSAKYHVEVHASQGELPEGLSRMLDILQSAISPTKVTAPEKVA